MDTAPAVNLALIGAVRIEHPLVTDNSKGAIEVSTPPGTVSVDTARVQVGDALSSQFHERLITVTPG